MRESYDPEWDQKTKLVSAAVRDDVEMISLMYGAGVSVDTTDSYGEPAAHIAARLGKPRATTLLLALGADVSARGPTGRTLIHEIGASPSTLHLLPEVLRLGGDVNDRDQRGQTPLMAAVLRGSIDGARALLRHGADPLLRDDDDRTVVYHLVAGIYGFRRDEPHTAALSLLRDLVGRGIDPHAAGPGGKTAFTVAAEKGLDDVLTALSSTLR